jgi:hypothetical protein
MKSDSDKSETVENGERKARWLRRLVGRIRKWIDARKLKRGWVIKKYYEPPLRYHRAMPPGQVNIPAAYWIVMAGTTETGEPKLRWVSVKKWYYDEVKIGDEITMD